MICTQHGKDIETVCNWCGKQLCKKCFSKTDGKKRFCSNCVAQIGDLIKEKQLEKIKDMDKKDSSDEYFNFSKLKVRE